MTVYAGRQLESCSAVSPTTFPLCGHVTSTSRKRVAFHTHACIFPSGRQDDTKIPSPSVGKLLRSNARLVWRNRLDSSEHIGRTTLRAVGACTWILSAAAGRIQGSSSPHRSNKGDSYPSSRSSTVSPGPPVLIIIRWNTWPR